MVIGHREKIAQYPFQLFVYQNINNKSAAIIEKLSNDLPHKIASLWPGRGSHHTGHPWGHQLAGIQDLNSPEKICECVEKWRFFGVT